MSGPRGWPDTVSLVKFLLHNRRWGQVGRSEAWPPHGVESGLNPSLHYVSKDSPWKRLSKYLRNSVKK